MLLKKTNLHEKLNRERRNQIGSPETVLNQVYEIFEDVKIAHKRIESNLSQKNNTRENCFDIDLLEASNIYHIDQIKKVCIDYRLRFLNTKFFKGKIPTEAISKINELEHKHKSELSGFKIIAPSKMFKLEDKDDPILFAPIGNGYYYLIHKWGNDLHPLRKLLMWPFKSIINLIFTLLAFSFLTTLLVPEGLFSKSSSATKFWIIYFFMFKCIASVVLFYGVARGKNFNPAIWNNKYIKV
jgi:hypothetical protein